VLVEKVDTTSKKSATRLRKEQFSEIGESTGRFFHYLNSDVFMKFLEELTSVQNLMDDPAVTGAGVSSIDYGGFLNIHADFSQEPQKAPGWRRLNLLLYLNDAWEESFGGSLELWKTNMAHEDFQYVGKILPVFNRAVIFSTTDISMHGHMDLIVEGKSRLTLSTYYYTKERQDDLIAREPHSTIYPLHFFGTESFTRWKDTKPSCPLIA
jgi:Rps23 Pro-64 3,4-dihydroxylase Tpa1-like proline 4-hydroxylase